MLKSKFSLSRHLEYANEQITYHKKIYYFVELLLLDIALFEYAPHSIVNVNKQLKRGSTRVFFYFDKTTEQVTIIQLVTILLIYKVKKI
jgi:hypothetical protein